MLRVLQDRANYSPTRTATRQIAHLLTPYTEVVAAKCGRVTICIIVRRAAPRRAAAAG